MSVTSPGLPAEGPSGAEAGAACALHPDATAAATCERCGAFACSDCLGALGSKLYCATCRERSDVDYTLGIKEKYWGKRDGYVWFFGIVGSIGNLAPLVLGGTLLLQDPVSAILTLGAGAFSLTVFVSYLFLKPWARLGLFGVVLAKIVAGVLAPASAGMPGPPGAAAAITIGQQIFPFLFFLSAYFSVRNRLAFRIDVPRKGLEKMYRTYYDNQLARTGFVLSLCSLLLPGLFVFSAILCTVGLRRVDPESVPPIGRKKTAIAGLILSALGLVMTIGILALNL